MLYFKKYIWCALFLCFSNLVIGQNYNQEDQLLNQLNYSLAKAIEGENVISAIQSGNGNDLIISQFSKEQVAIIQQVGVENILKAVQKGNRQIIEIFQRGDLNFVESALYGNNISSSIHQYGDNNSLQQEVIGNNKSFEITQVGNDNELIQIDTGNTTRGYSVSQVGNGMTVIIQSGL